MFLVFSIYFFLKHNIDLKKDLINNKSVEMSIDNITLEEILQKISMLFREMDVMKKLP